MIPQRNRHINLVGLAKDCHANVLPIRADRFHIAHFMVNQLCDSLGFVQVVGAERGRKGRYVSITVYNTGVPKALQLGKQKEPVVCDRL